MSWCGWIGSWLWRSTPQPGLNVVGDSAVIPKKKEAFKVTLLGESEVGKTSIATRVSRNQFYPSLDRTLGAAFVTRSIDLDGKQIRLEIWDTAGTERFKAVVPLYFREANAVLLVYDITRESTLASVNYWYAQVKEQAPECTMILVGNKSDLEASREVTLQQGKNLATKLKCPHLEVSCLTADNIEDLLETIGRVLLLRFRSNV